MESYYQELYFCNIIIIFTILLSIPNRYPIIRIIS